jgi:hypothetical protein
MGSRRKPVAIFCVNTLLARSVGHDNDFNMMIPKPGEVDPDNIINVTMEDLSNTQKQLLHRRPWMITSKYASELSALTES